MELTDFQALTSVSRFQKYIDVNEYIAAVGRASQIQQMLHWVEIGYRNHIYEGIQVTSSYQHPCSSWLTCKCSVPPVFLNPNSVARVERAKSFLSPSDRENPNVIIPGLSFGFWVRLLSTSNEATIWTPGLYKSFPRKTNRSDLHNLLRRMNLIRNRIAHLEPVDRYPLSQISNDSLLLIDFIAPKLDKFMNEEFRRIRSLM